MMRIPKSSLDAPRKVLGRLKKGALFPAAAPLSEMPKDYSALLEDLKDRICEARIRTALSANAALLLLYWDLGKMILSRQTSEGWGAKVVDRLSVDLRQAFPNMRGLSPRNLKYMRAFAAAWPDRAIVQEALAQIPWYHNIALLEKLASADDRLWYARKTLEQCWSHDILVIQIQKQIHARQGKAVTNFPSTLPPAQSDMAAQVFKDPYLFDFLGMADTRREREVEQALVDHIQRFLLEMGRGFAFVGRQVLLEVGDTDFLIDLLFYHINLRRYVVVELKAGPFDPAFLGQLNVYLSAADDLLRHHDDRPTIGLLLCRSKNRIVVEYALRNLNKPIGVAQWETTVVKSLPKELKGILPTVQEIEAEFSGNVDVELPIPEKRPVIRGRKV